MDQYQPLRLFNYNIITQALCIDGIAEHKTAYFAVAESLCGMNEGSYGPMHGKRA